jgi:hypothetical protein
MLPATTVVGLLGVAHIIDFRAAKWPARLCRRTTSRHGLALQTPRRMEKTTMTKKPTMTKPSFYAMSFARVYPMYVKKAESKSRTKAEVDQIILWLTGHTAKSLQKAIDAEIDIETFYAKAPRFQPKASLITGAVCGIRVEEIEDETMRKIRYLDKLIDELAKGKAMEKILRK